MKAEIAMVCVALMLAACGEGPASQPTAAAPPIPSRPAQPPQTLQGPDAYVGRWAATPQLCAGGAWDFKESGVSTAGEVSCRFDKVTPTSSGFEIDARCVAQAPETRHGITLTLTDPAPPQAMTVAGGPWSGPVTLMRCGDS